MRMNFQTRFIRRYRFINEMQKGDDIYSRNAQNRETGIQEAEEAFCTGTNTVYHIWLDGEGEIKMAVYHPIDVFYIEIK